MGEIQEKTEATQLGQQPVRGEEVAPGSPQKWRPDLRKWWLVEIWKENREVFKALVVHTIFFVLLIEALSLLASRIEHSGLPQQRKAVLEALDFYLTAIALVAFGFDFIMKILIHFWRSDRHKESKQ